LQDEIHILKVQLDTTQADLATAEQKAQSICQEYENVAQAFIAKKEKYKQEITALKQAKPVLEQVDNAELVELKAQLKQADSLILEMQTETQEIVQKLKEKHEKRDQKNKAKIQDLVAA